LEITSYGGLFDGMSKEDFFSGLSLPKNKEQN
jgi:predicted HTH transcriptional regulator